MAKTLCKLKKTLHDDWPEYRKLVGKPKVVCRSCGRLANKKKLVCKPEKL